MKKIILFFILLFIPLDVNAANRFWVGGTDTWNSTAGSKWATTSGGVGGAAVPTSADDCKFDANSGAGTVTTSGTSTDICKSIDFTGFTGTFDHAAGTTITIAGSVTFDAGMTYTPTATSQITISATSTLTTAGLLMPLIAITSGTTTLADNLNFIASKVITLTLSGNVLDLNGKTISGNSSINRIFIKSNTLGTARTITISSGTFANADFQDITASASTDVSAITGLSGDCGGNTSFTFTTGTTQTWAGTSGGNWSDNAWTSRVPLCQDDVNIQSAFSASQTITADMPRLGKSINFTGSTGSPIFALTSTENSIYGSLTLISGMTLSHNKTLNFQGRGNFTLDMAGKSFATLVDIEMPGGTLTLNSNYSNTGSTTTLSNGTFDANGYNVALLGFSSSNSNIRTINMGTGTWTVTGSGTRWILTTTTNLTFNAGTSTLVSATNGQTFSLGGLTYHKISIKNGVSTNTIQGSNTFNKIIASGGTTSITLTGGTTTTLLSGEGLENGNNLITFLSSSGSATFSKSSGTVSWNYVSLTNIESTGGAAFYAGSNSIDGGGNTGWIFSGAPSTGNALLMGSSLD